MKELIIHVGYSKCASSTLQNFLSLNFSDETSEYEYCAINKNGNILNGSALKTAAINSPYKYCNSTVDFNNISSLKRAFELLNNKMKNKTVIISNEGLVNKNIITQDLINLLNSLRVPIKIFVLIRPPADWFNASWWQWGCWTELSLNEYFQKNKDINMLQGILQWETVKTVKEIKVADISQNPVESFLQFIGVRKEHLVENQINTSSSADLIKFLLKNKHRYNRTEHNPTIEFILNSLLEGNYTKPPFIANANMASEIICSSIDDNKKLLKMTDWNKNNISESNYKKYIDANEYDSNIFNYDEFINSNYSNDFLVDVVNVLISKYR